MDGAVGTAAGNNLVLAEDGEHVAASLGAQVGGQDPVLSVALIPGEPPGRDPGVQRAGNHRPRQGGLGRERDMIPDTGGGTAARVIGPRLRQVSLPVEEGVPTARGVDEVDPT